MGVSARRSQSPSLSTLLLLSALSVLFSAHCHLLSSILLLSPAPLEQINSCLSLTLSKCTGYKNKTSLSSLAAAICLAANSKVDSNFLSRLSVAVSLLLK